MLFWTLARIDNLLNLVALLRFLFPFFRWTLPVSPHQLSACPAVSPTRNSGTRRAPPLGVALKRCRYDFAVDLNLVSLGLCRSKSSLRSSKGIRYTLSNTNKYKNTPFDKHRSPYINQSDLLSCVLGYPHRNRVREPNPCYSSNNSSASSSSYTVGNCFIRVQDGYLSRNNLGTLPKKYHRHKLL